MASKLECDRCRCQSDDIHATAWRKVTVSAGYNTPSPYDLCGDCVAALGAFMGPAASPIGIALADSFLAGGDLDGGNR